MRLLSKFKPLLVIWPSHPKAVQDCNQRFWMQNHGQVHGAAVWQHWSQLDWGLWTGMCKHLTLLRLHCCSSHCWPGRLAIFMKTAATLVILTHFESHKGLIICKFWAVTKHIIFMWNEIWWFLHGQVTFKSNTYSLAQYFDHSLISEWMFQIDSCAEQQI